MNPWKAAITRIRTAVAIPHSRKDLGQYVLIIAACFLAGRLGVIITVLHPPVSPVWPPIGVALAAMILLGYRVWPAVFIASLLICKSTSTPFEASFAISVANTLEVVAATYLIKKFAQGVKAFETAWDATKFVIFASILTPAISATLCIGYLYPAGFPQGPDKAIMWLTWWVGDSIGALLFAPFLILAFSISHHHLDKRELLELCILLLSLITVCLTVFGPLSAFFEQRQLLQAWMCIPFLLWAGFRFCQLEAAGTTLILFGLAIWGTLHGYGPFVSADSNVSLMVLAAFVGITGTATLAIAATLSERRRVQEGLLGLQSLLQESIQGKARDLTATIESLQSEVVERMVIETDLRESNDRFRQLAENICDVFWLMDTIEDRLLYVSPAYETVWGLPRSNLYADPHSWINSVHPDDHEHALVFFARGRTTESRFDAEFRIIRPDGSIRYIWDRGFFIRNETGEICRIAGLASDITERKQLEHELQEAQKLRVVRD
jgi:PAS domain S-box-containing protein